MSEQSQKREPDRQQTLGQLAKQLAASSLIGDYLAVIRGAVRRTVIPPTKEVEFFFGAVGGFIASFLACGLLAMMLALPAPMALLFVMLPFTLASGVLVSRVVTLRKKPVFTFPEERELERSESLYRQKTLAIAERRKELQTAGLSDKEIEARLGDASDKALMQLLDDLDRIKPAHAAMMSEQSRRMLGPAAPDQRSDRDTDRKA